MIKAISLRVKRIVEVGQTSEFDQLSVNATQIGIYTCQTIKIFLR